MLGLLVFWKKEIFSPPPPPSSTLIEDMLNFVCHYLVREQSSHRFLRFSILPDRSFVLPLFHSSLSIKRSNGTVCIHVSQWVSPSTTHCDASFLAPHFRRPYLSDANNKTITSRGSCLMDTQWDTRVLFPWHVCLHCDGHWDSREKECKNLWVAKSRGEGEETKSAPSGVIIDRR